MRITPEQLPRHLQKPLAPLFIVSGDELLLCIEAADAIRTRAREEGYSEREIFPVDHKFNWSELRQRSSSLSLFGERRLMDIRIPSGKPGTQGSAVIEEYCQALPPDTLTLVTLPRIDRQSAAAKWFKALEGAGITIQVDAVERPRLPVWIGQRLEMQQQSADQDTLQFVADKVEGNLVAAYQELKKLALLYPPGPMSFEQVKDAVLDVARYDVYKLSAAMIRGEIARYNRVLEGLRGEGAALPLIVFTLATQIRALITIRKGLDAGRPKMQLMNQIRARVDQQEFLQSAAKRLRLEQLMQALIDVSKIDRISKGAAKGDAWDELLQLGLRFAIPAR